MPRELFPFRYAASWRSNGCALAIWLGATRSRSGTRESEIVGAPEVREGGAWGAGFMLAQIATTPPANNLYGSFA